MNVEPLTIPDVLLLTPRRFHDPRGFFSETWNETRFTAAGISGPFVQDNHAVSNARGVLRGLHCQIGRNAQGKLIRVVKGAIWDVAVDIRHGSPSHGQHVAVVLTSKDGEQLFIPEGFAHGFCTLEPDTEVIYKVNRYYSPEHDRGMLWNDPALQISWPIPVEGPVMSEKDKHHPCFAELPKYFTYG